MNGRLSLSTAFDGQKTVTEDLYFAPPFKVYSPFYDHKGWAKYISWLLKLPNRIRALLPNLALGMKTHNGAFDK